MATQIDFDKLDMRDNLLFGAVFERYPDACRRTLETILGFSIAEVVELRREVMVEPGILSRGVRLDVRVKDNEGRVYDIEMQKSSEETIAQTSRWLLRRARYYQGATDADLANKGTKISDLPELHIIFICDFDPLQRGQRRYTVTRTCKEDNKPADNGVHEVYLCCSSGKGKVSAELDSLLRYFGGDDSVETELVHDLRGMVKAVKADEAWRAERMMLQEMLDQERELGRLQGIEQGIEQGREQGIEQERRENNLLLAELTRSLSDAGRLDELAPAMLDPELRSRLLDEFGIR